MRMLLNPWRCRVEPVVLHLQPTPRLEAKSLAGGQGDLPQDLKPKVLPSLLLMSATAAFAAGNGPDLWEQRTRKGLVALHQIVQVGREIADGPVAVLDTIRHQRPEPETTGVVLHPTGLERSVLAVVAEHQQALALGVVNHVLRQHMDVRHVDRPHLACGLPIVAAGAAPAKGSARQATRQQPRVVLVLLDGPKLHGRRAFAAMSASRDRVRMGRPAMAAEVQGRSAGVGRRVFVVARADQVIHQDDPLAALILRQRLPVGAVGTGIPAAGCVPREAEVLEVGDKVVLSAGRAGCDGEMSSPVSFAAVHLFGGEPEPRGLQITRERYDSAADPAHEGVNDRTQQRPAVPSRGRAQRQPGEHFGLRYGPTDGLLQSLREFP